MPESESTFALARTFIGRLVHHWAALATGGVIMAGVWAANSLAGWQIPWIVNVALAVIFFGFAAFQTWRDEHLKVTALEREPLRPIEMRKRLDAFVSAGKGLFNDWLSGSGPPPKRQTEEWDASVIDFVERHFSVRQSDIFKAHMLTDEGALEVVLEHSNTRADEGYAAAQLIIKRIEALE
jgi:hypothetical protein